MESAACPISATRLRSRSCMAAIASSSRPVSSWMRTSTCDVRSPRAMRSATTTARAIGWVMLAVMRQAISRPSAMAATTSTPPIQRARLWIASAEAAASSLSLFCSAINSPSCCRQIDSAGAARVIRFRLAVTVSPSSAACIALSISGLAFWAAACTCCSNAVSAALAVAGVMSCASCASCLAYSCKVFRTAWICSCACLGSISLSMALERLNKVIACAFCCWFWCYEN